MQAKPVRRKADPRYPTRLEVLADAGLLEKHMPAAWKSCAELAGAAAILLTVNGCVGEHPHSGHFKAIVAPIFEHGEGRGVYGCEVVNPPVFLSEQDALQVISEELRKTGVVLSDKDATVPGVLIPQREEKWFLGGAIKFDIETGSPKPLSLQGFDPKKKVGVAFVSLSNYSVLGGVESGSLADCDFKEVAERARAYAARDGHDLYLGTFYAPTIEHEASEPRDSEYNDNLGKLIHELHSITDPAAQKQKANEIEKLREQHLEPFTRESSRLLRMQVKDFVDWLKGQGVI